MTYSISTIGFPDEFVNLCLIINSSTAFCTSFPKLFNRLFCCDREVISSSGLLWLLAFIIVIAIREEPICKRIWYNGSISNPNNLGPESLVVCFLLIF